MPCHRALRWVRRLVWRLIPLVLLITAPLAAQQPSSLRNLSPDQVRELLRTRPDLVQLLQARLGASGLTPDQIRERLRAAGYPPDLLDDYLKGGKAPSAQMPGLENFRPETFRAAQAIGLLSVGEADTLQVIDSLQFLSDAERFTVDSIRRHFADSVRADSLGDSTFAGGRLKRFGIDVFRRFTSRFQVAPNGPVDKNYVLGPGDVLVLILTGDVEDAYTLDLNREGFIMVPQVGQIYAANLTLGQLETQLYTRLKKVYSGIGRGANASTRFDITVAKVRNIQVYVIGDVVRPGGYQISAAGTVLTALYAAGGPTDNGSFRRVEVRRGGQAIAALDLYDYLVRGINATDVRLESGDVIFVPPHGGLVDVTGRVTRPAIYEIKDSTTLRDVLQAAGGLQPTALRQRIQIHRLVQENGPDAPRAHRVVLEIGPDQLADAYGPAVPVQAGDSIVAFPVPNRRSGFVTVSGAVWTPGEVGFSSGMTLADAIRLAGGPRPDVYLDRVLVTRHAPDSTRVQLHAALIDSTGRVAENLPLQDGDEIRLFSRTAMLTDRYVVITGAVRRPGRIHYRQGMTLRDAVLMADGLTDDAALGQAEIARLPEGGPSPTVTARSIKVPLDSSYLLQRGVTTPSPSSADVPLEPWDNVLIPRRSDFSLVATVAIAGQVKHPGRYPLETRTDRITDLIQRAGGLTDIAYPGGVEFFRAPTGLALVENRRGRIGIDLPRVLKDAKFRDNLILQPGDSLFIPEFIPVVLVDGAVNSPGNVAFTPGKSLDWYVRSAGGYAQTADRNRAYVTQPDGTIESVNRKFLLADDVPHPRPGAVITVPVHNPALDKPSNVPTIIGTAAQILASLITIIVVAKQ